METEEIHVYAATQWDQKWNLQQVPVRCNEKKQNLSRIYTEFK